MKKLAILLFLSSLCICRIYGQMQHSTQKEYVSFSNKFYENNGLHLMGQWQDEFGKTNFGLKALATTKDSIAIIEKLEISGENSRLTHIITKPEGGYVGIYFEKGCRYAAKGNFIFHLNSDFTIARAPVRIQYFFRNIKEPIHSAHFIYKNTLVLATKKDVVTYDIATRRVISKNDTLSTYDIVFPYDNQFVCIEKNKFHIFNVFCNVVGSQVIDFTPKSLFRTRSGNGFIGIGKHKVAVLNEKGVVIFDYNWQNLSNDFDSLISGHFHSDTLIVLGKKGTSFKLAKMNSQFDILNAYNIGSTTFYQDPILLADVYLKNNKAFIIKSALSKIEFQNYLEVFNLSKPSITKNADIQIGLASIDSLSSKSEGNQLHCNFYGQYSLTNMSTDTLRSFFFKWKSSANEECNGPQKAELVTCYIEPGAQQTFKYVVSDSFLIPEAGYSICINVMAPNKGVDTLYLNNRSCTNTILPPVSVENDFDDKWKMPSMLRAGDVINIEQEIENCFVVNANGKSWQLSTQNQVINLPINLKSGIYIINLITETKRYSQRFLIVN
ncbi:MAG: T9SS type A sorting domain-containing protein [Bacteroidia bacterium]